MFLLLRKIEIIDKENPKKFEPTSPIYVFAGLKLNGKKPTIAPPNAVISKIAISGDEGFRVNTINNEIHDIKVIPEDNPSKPSIKLIALVIPTIQPTVKMHENQSWNQIVLSINGKFTFSILMPDATTIIAAIICAISFIPAGTFL